MLSPHSFRIFWFWDQDFRKTLFHNSRVWQLFLQIPNRYYFMFFHIKSVKSSEKQSLSENEVQQSKTFINDEYDAVIYASINFNRKSLSVIFARVSSSYISITIFRPHVAFYIIATGFPRVCIFLSITLKFIFYSCKWL